MQKAQSAAGSESPLVPPNVLCVTNNVDTACQHVTRHLLTAEVPGFLEIRVKYSKILALLFPFIPTDPQLNLSLSPPGLGYGLSSLLSRQYPQ